MKALICGGRRFKNREAAFAEFDRLRAELGITEIAEGGQRTYDREKRKLVGGADYFAEQWAKERGIPCQTFEAEWRRWGGAAGQIRNQKMIDVFKPDVVIALPGEAGTMDMTRRARLEGIKVIELALDTE